VHEVARTSNLKPHIRIHFVNRCSKHLEDENLRSKYTMTYLVTLPMSETMCLAFFTYVLVR